MTVSLSDYEGLITSEHRGKPDFLATIDESVTPYVATQNVTFSLVDAFDLDDAVGVQLDQVGIWVGISRVVPIPLTGVYFSWNTANLGWGQGVWRGPFDSPTTLTSLDDATYRILLRAKIAANHWDGTIPTAKRALDTLLVGTVSPDTKVSIYDGLDMSMKFVISGAIPPVIIQQVLALGLLHLRPTGVLASTWITSVPDTPVFAWNTESPHGAGWGEGAWATKIG